jgi:hypothetical protein
MLKMKYKRAKGCIAQLKREREWLLNRLAAFEVALGSDDDSDGAASEIESQPGTLAPSVSATQKRSASVADVMTALQARKRARVDPAVNPYVVCTNEFRNRLRHRMWGQRRRRSSHRVRRRP